MPNSLTTDSSRPTDDILCAHQIAKLTLEDMADAEPLERTQMDEAQAAIGQFLDASIHGPRQDEHIEGSLITSRSLLIQFAALYQRGAMTEGCFDLVATVLGRTMIALSTIYIAGEVSSAALEAMLGAGVPA
jgi:hypothetical protein